MINGETGSLSMDVKIPLDKGVRCYREGARLWSQEAALPLIEVWDGDKELGLR